MLSIFHSLLLQIETPVCFGLCKKYRARCECHVLLSRVFAILFSDYGFQYEGRGMGNLVHDFYSALKTVHKTSLTDDLRAC